MKYNREIQYILDIINSTFIEENISPIPDNTYFEIDEISSESYLRIRLNKKDSVFLLIIIDTCGFEVYLDRANEIILISSEQINSNPSTLREWIKILFFLKIRIEYIGSHHTNIYFYNKENKRIRRLMYNEGLLGLLPVKIGKKEVHEYACLFQSKSIPVFQCKSIPL